MCRGDCVRAAPIAGRRTVVRMKATDSSRYPQGKPGASATSRQLWRLNQEGWLALRKAPDTPLGNRQCARVISQLAEKRLHERFDRERGEDGS